MENKPVTKTFLKFKKYDKKFVAFVHEDESGKLIGVREEDERLKKKACFLSKKIKTPIQENKLYNVELVPTKGHRAFIVTSLHETQHRARVKVEINDVVCQAVLTYGNRRIFYNPLKGHSEFSTTAEGVEKIIAEAEISNKKEAHESMKKAMAKVDEYIRTLPRGKVETLVTSKCYYQSIIKFGTYQIVYNPFDGVGKERSVKQILALIDNKISNRDEVREAFLKSIRVVHRHMEADGFFVKKDAV